MLKPTSPKQLAESGKYRRKKPFDYEGREQTQLINWIRGECRRGAMLHDVEHLIYAVPNGGSRHKLEAAKMKAQSVRAGVSDLVLPMARGGYFGLYLELKATPPHNADVSKSQRDWVALVSNQGYLGIVAMGIEHAKEIISWYLRLKNTVPLDTSTLSDVFSPPPVPSVK